MWGAVVKATGHEFIYRNEVMKFRDIALRGPWTSGGIEFNFGVIGHTPATSTPVDYLVRENADGSVSTIVGAMDLPSRTQWRVEIRLPAERAAFETRVLWHNPTPLEQPYYNWMTAAAFARDDLELFVPGNAYLEHSGRARPWPVDEDGRFLPLYRNNAFGGSKSYHVVGELNDFFGGYYHDDGYGWGHWARHEDMPGRKLWLWSLSREGGIWEDLLTDTDGQYVEFQAGRLLVQYQPGADRNPISQAGFDPLSASRWTETWFPLEGTGGLTDASPRGAMHVEREDGRLRVVVQAFGAGADTVKAWSGGEQVAARPVALEPLDPVVVEFDVAPGRPWRVSLPGLGLEACSNPGEAGLDGACGFGGGRSLSRPFETDAEAWDTLPQTDRLVFEARELARGRRYAEARTLYERAAAAEPWNREALLGLGALALRSARHEEGLAHARRALQLDTYDPEANFLAGNLYRALGRRADALDSFGWAARSVAFRSAARVRLAELALDGGDVAEARRHAALALDHDRGSIPAREVLAIAARLAGDETGAARVLAELLELDPLHHFVLAERYLAARAEGSGGEEARGGADAARLAASMRSEFPGQTLLELAVGYANRGLPGDAAHLLELADEVGGGPVAAAWLAFLMGDADMLRAGAAPDFAFPLPHRNPAGPALGGPRRPALGLALPAGPEPVGARPRRRGGRSVGDPRRRARLRTHLRGARAPDGGDGRRPRVRFPARGRGGSRQPHPPRLPHPALAGSGTLGGGARGVRPGTGTLPGRLQPRPAPRASAPPGGPPPRCDSHPRERARPSLGGHPREPSPVRVRACRGRAGRARGREPRGRPPSSGGRAAVAGIARSGPSLRSQRTAGAVPARGGGGRCRWWDRAWGCPGGSIRLAARPRRCARRRGVPDRSYRASPRAPGARRPALGTLAAGIGIVAALAAS